MLYILGCTESAECNFLRCSVRQDMQAQRILPADPGFAAYTDIRNLMNNVPVGSRKNGPDYMDFARVECQRKAGIGQRYLFQTADMHRNRIEEKMAG